MTTLTPEDLLVLQVCRSDIQDLREALISARTSLDSAIFFAGRAGVSESLAVEDVFTAENWLLGLQGRVAKTLAMLATVTPRLKKQRAVADAKRVCIDAAADAAYHRERNAVASRAAVVDEAPSASKPRGDAP